ncbi:hypothetical protein KSF_024940 [Reticulibacter mediterranei]|uniref:Rrf2 family transcriptional regulator n=1 Tax=Reticulibacter mediterranei TaxID=2778369 RepID=A0A8J3ILM6_9CHLR|nr:Rrf2 family transcriptional regulator [Reticulibacter mediterranei]GHO92446.1 hypothetical protein KSF_024940 [Reticulibacter mediterranei]
MKYSAATNYALHTMLYFVASPPGKTIGVQQLAELQKISPTYLSKILTRLVKAGLIESAPGVNGGIGLSGTGINSRFLRSFMPLKGRHPCFIAAVPSTTIRLV